MILFDSKFGFWGPIHHEVLTPDEANACSSLYHLPYVSSSKIIISGCRDSWDHDSWTLIVGFLILSGKSPFLSSILPPISYVQTPTVLAVFFSILAFSYWRQLLDPTSPANASRAPSAQVRAGGYPSHYTPAYDNNYGGYNNSSVPNLPYQPYSANRGYGFSERDDPFAPPYEADGKPPGYIGAGTAGDFKGEDKGSDPFADDGPSLRDDRDVTSRPGHGGRETFH